MGRALFSTRYPSEPAVHEEPERQPEEYPTWGHGTVFDPDSDEFFLDAEYEAFLLDESHGIDHHLVEPNTQSAAPANANLQDSAQLTGSSPSSAHWPSTGPPWHLGQAAERSETQRLRAESDVVSAPPPVMDDDAQTAQRPATLSLPIDIPRTSTPSSGSDSSAPSTPPQAYSFGSFGTPQSYGMMGEISPPPSFSPRLYTWGSRARNSASPGSPSIGRGPLTNPSARASYPRIISASPALRV